jgi:hypothetical protein
VFLKGLKGDWENQQFVSLASYESQSISGSLLYLKLISFVRFSRGFLSRKGEQFAPESWSCWNSGRASLRSAISAEIGYIVLLQRGVISTGARRKLAKILIRRVVQREL